MKILIDATTLLLPSAGIKNYVYYWIQSLVDAASNTGDTISTYPFGISVPSVLDHQQGATGSMSRFLRLLAVHFANIRKNPAIDLLALGSDVFHCSQHTANIPRGRKITATVFDFSCWRTPQFHTRANVAATRLYAEKILQACDGLIAISHHARKEAIEILNIAPDRIRAIYPGVAQSFYEVSPDQVAAVGSRYSLNKPYILFVGCIEPRKNIPNIVRAYRRLPAPTRAGAELVVAGPFGWADEDLRAMLTDRIDGVRYLGYVPEPELPGLFRGAELFVYPSYYEGFGLPVAQAMAAGRPVIVSNRSCLPEVVGDAGFSIDPDSEDELCAAIGRFLAFPEIRTEFSNRAHLRAQQFRWSIAATQSLRFFHEVTDSK